MKTHLSILLSASIVMSGLNAAPLQGRDNPGNSRETAPMTTPDSYRTAPRGQQDKDLNDYQSRLIPMDQRFTIETPTGMDIRGEMVNGKVQISDQSIREFRKEFNKFNSSDKMTFRFEGGTTISMPINPPTYLQNHLGKLGRAGIFSPQGLNSLEGTSITIMLGRDTKIKATIRNSEVVMSPRDTNLMKNAIQNMGRNQNLSFILPGGVVVNTNGSPPDDFIPIIVAIVGTILIIWNW